VRKSLLVVLASIAALTVSATGVLADNIVIPWWRHGKDPNPVTNKSTVQAWEFGDNSFFNVPADEFTNPQINPPLAVLGATISPPAIWTSELSERSGVWSLSGGAIMALQIPNYSDGPEKKIWIQLTWMPEQQGAEPAFNLMTLPPYDFFDDVLVTEQSLDDGWIHSTYLILVRPNPELEIVNITGDIYVDEVVVDTICPEPATMAILGLAVPFVLRRKRKN